MQERQTRQKALIALCAAVIIALLILFALSGDNWHLLKSLFGKDLSNEQLSDQLKEFGWRGYIAIAALGDMCDPPLKKSGINNRLRRIEELAAKL